MQIEDGKFYFINDNFIEKYGVKYKLMTNKETGNKRPCYFCFKDEENDNIVWFVPISRQVEKYKKIYETKKHKMNKEPLNFVFGKVRNSDSVFLIQNMFPTIEKYILEKYTVNKTNDVTIFEDTKIDVLSKARSILKLAKNRNIHIAFSNLIEFKKELLNDN
ncbi:MAG: hypothetical protein RSE41_03315 [Clostridia bacterium]